MMTIQQWQCTNKEDRSMPWARPLNSAMNQLPINYIPSQHAKPIIESKWAVQNYVKMAPNKMINKKSIK